MANDARCNHENLVLLFREKQLFFFFCLGPKTLSSELNGIESKAMLRIRLTFKLNSKVNY